MYRIVKRIVHTITTVTWLVHLDGDAAEGKSVEKQITFPASHSYTEEEVSEPIDILERIPEEPGPILEEGENP